MLDEHYINPLLAELYDEDGGPSKDRQFYLSLPKASSQLILDLGCGTGLICNEYAAQGHLVTGVDPAPAMLEIARKKPHGDKVEWVEATAQSHRSEKKFDLIIMTGHAFQVLLTDEDIAAAFTTIHDHLKPNGMAVFESRNPAIDWATRWNHDGVIKSGAKTIGLSRRVLEAKSGWVKFETHYMLSTGTLASTSELRFLADDEIHTRLTAAGLAVEHMFGDWDASLFDHQKSEEMIFLIHHKNRK
ncbi:MAG: class I SAM-dependent methyltransferase [Rhizobiaceae bacterium]